MASMINTNVTALNTQRNLSASQSALNSSVQRLSSGLRVNSAKDDAAGLAIAERMNAQVKGIGVWTVHMFLIFSLGRLDILPVGDLGIRRGIERLYGFDDLPAPDQIEALADEKGWRPYCSVASWFLWRSLENKTNAE